MEILMFQLIQVRKLCVTLTSHFPEIQLPKLVQNGYHNNKQKMRRNIDQAWLL